MAAIRITKPIIVAIARLPIAINGGGQTLARRLATTYPGCSHEEEPQFTIELSNHKLESSFRGDQLAMPLHPGSPHLQILGTTILIHEPTWQARLDLALGEGQIWAAEACQFEATEYALRIICAYLAFAAGGLLVHGAGIAYNRQGYLFLGPSGAGKTTAARNAPAGSVLNDDLILLMPEPEEWRMEATPFTNPSQVAPSGLTSVPLAEIFRLIQAPQVTRRSMSRAAVAAELISLAPVVSLDPHCAPILLRRAHQIAATIPGAYLELLPDSSYWSAILPAAERTTL